MGRRRSASTAAAGPNINGARILDCSAASGLCLRLHDEQCCVQSSNVPDKVRDFIAQSFGCAPASPAAARKVGRPSMILCDYFGPMQGGRRWSWPI